METACNSPWSKLEKYRFYFCETATERPLDTGPTECCQPEFLIIFFLPSWGWGGGSPERAEAESIPRYGSSACGPHQSGPPGATLSEGREMGGLTERMEAAPVPLPARANRTGCCRWCRRIKTFGSPERLKSRERRLSDGGRRQNKCPRFQRREKKKKPQQ